MVAVSEAKKSRKEQLMDELDRTDALIAENEAKRAEMISRKAPISGFIDLQPFIMHVYKRRETLLWELKKAGGNEKELFDRRRAACGAMG